ncbi:MAG: ABC transporter ATP-binding protein [Gemmatimonadota bacterium]|nr:ABC transporter ATP-binding protein [Gemmatimonadota bacterium]
MTAVAPPAIRMSDVDKAFGPVQANRGASLEVARGEIHALVGENGAGKSTLMRVLAGMYQPNGGRIEVEGRDVTGWSTAAAIDAGVGMVHQHFMLIPTLTVAENLVLGQEPTRAGQLDTAGAVREVQELSERTGLVVPPDRKVAELSVGEAQRVEILKALYRGARILILDEPTAVLSPPEVRELWQVLRRLRAEAGGTVVLITHKLDEVVEVSDTVTVMRGGRTVGRMRTADTSPKDIARAMVGRDVALVMDQGVPGPQLPVPTRPTGNLEPGTRNPLLSVQDLTVSGARKSAAVDHVSFSVAPGEILGIAGVEGNGQTELIEAIAGLRPVAAGQLLLAGADGTLRDVGNASVRARADAGLSHIPEDRHARGLVLDYSVADNLILGLQHRFSRGLRLDWERIAENARRQVSAFDIRPPDPLLPARALSGGNQQKVVIAREMGRDFRVLLAAQPTRGVDVGAIEFIHDRLREARRAGKAILLVSADLPEVLALSDRVGVMYGGRLVAVLPRAEANLEVLGRYMTGAAEAA